MAKSIFEILDGLRTETSVPVTGKSIEHTLPRNLFPTSEQFENEEMLLTWARDNGCLHACLQSGVQKFLIDIRAIFKSVKKDEVWTAEKGQEKVNSAKWSIVERPKVGGSKAVDTARFKDCMALISKLVAKNMPLDIIKETATEVYGEEVVNTIFTTLEGLTKGE